MLSDYYALLIVIVLGVWIGTSLFRITQLLIEGPK